MQTGCPTLLEEHMAIGEMQDLGRASWSSRLKTTTWPSKYAHGLGTPS